MVFIRFWQFSRQAPIWLGSQVVIGVPPVALGYFVLLMMYYLVMTQCWCLKRKVMWMFLSIRYDE